MTGKLAYMCPEVYSGKEFNGVHADLWCLGVMLFTQLFGVPPFKTACAGLCPVYNAMLTHGMQKLLQSWAFVDRVSAHAVDIVVRMLMPSPEARLTFQEVVDHPWLEEYRALFDTAAEVELPPATQTDSDTPVKEPLSCQSASKDVDAGVVDSAAAVCAGAGCGGTPSVCCDLDSDCLRSEKLTPPAVRCAPGDHPLA